MNQPCERRPSTNRNTTILSNGVGVFWITKRLGDYAQWAKPIAQQAISRVGLAHALL